MSTLPWVIVVDPQNLHNGGRVFWNIDCAVAVHETRMVYAPPTLEGTLLDLQANTPSPSACTKRPWIASPG